MGLVFNVVLLESELTYALIHSLRSLHRKLQSNRFLFSLTRSGRGYKLAWKVAFCKRKDELCWGHEREDKETPTEVESQARSAAFAHRHGRVFRWLRRHHVRRKPGRLTQRWRFLSPLLPDRENGHLCKLCNSTNYTLKENVAILLLIKQSEVNNLIIYNVISQVSISYSFIMM